MMTQQEVHTTFDFKFDGTRLAAVERGVKRATTNLNTIAAKTDLFQQRMGGFFQRARQVVGAYLGFRAIRSITTDYAVSADAVAKFATATGLSTEKYQGLVHAVKLGGSDQANLNKALTQLSKRALEAGQGLKTQQRAFGELGVEYEDGAGKLKSADQLFLEISDSFRNMTDESKRTGLSMQLLGRTGATLLPTMLEGSRGIKIMIAEAKKLGIVLSKEQLKAAENFNDEMLRVKSVLTGVRNIIAARLLPTITRQLRAFRSWWVEGRNAERAMRALKLIAIFTGLVIARMIGASVLRNVKLFVQGIWAGVQALRAMGLAASATALKVTAVFAAFVLIGLIIEDLIGFAQGKDSLIGRILGDSKLADDLRKGLIGLGRDAVKAWKEMKPALLDAWNALKPSLRELAVLLKPIAGPAFKAAIWLLIIGIEGLNLSVKALTFTIETLKGVATATSDALTWTAESVTIVWEDATDAIEKGIKDLGAAAKQIASLMGIDLGAAAKTAGDAWDLGLKGINKALHALNAVMSRALRLKGLLFGKDIGALNLAERTKKIRESYEVDVREGAPVLPGLFVPSPALAFAGGSAPASAPFGAATGIGASIGGLQQNIANTAVQAGAVQVTVQASGDPQQIAAAVNVKLAESMGKIITDASRDLVKPPRGQR